MFFLIFLFIKWFVVSEKICELCFQNNGSKIPICKFQEGPASNCYMYETLLKSDKDREEILDKINSRRNKVASGAIRSLPPAKDMLKLEWNDELALLAQRWADQCLSNDLIDECTGNGTIGQNIGTLYGEAPRLSPATLVDLWYMELLSFNSSIISDYRPSTKSRLAHYEDFTQLIWAKNRQVGCGAVKFQERSGNKNRTVQRLVCNFLPGGNINKQSVYNEGNPCSDCPDKSDCDSKYTYLCGQISILKENVERRENNLYSKILITKTSIDLDTDKDYSNEKLRESSNDTETDIAFDLYAYLFNVSNYEDTTKKESTTFCKNLLAVDEFVDLLRKKLSTDNIFRDLLLTKAPSGESQYTDAKVDAIVSKIYSKKTTSTTTKPTDRDVMNSTLLADLVEAVIFRNRDKMTSLEVVFPSTEVIEAKTVQMQAELGEIQRNLEFTGHYFFPEDSEDDQTDTTESYYDQSNIPVSEIIMELEELKRKQQTRDFVEEILESDSNANTITKSHIIASDNNMNGN
ncbi:peptidase inhibitor 16-like isoform X2 [Pieris brassicae]|uniref:peptidase inhibitor 16-like isoform X2 n=1 Tax=Pieris brassicae TaxID=7116 RepID=UPI001E661378|nr:peptidase inhibitor 16-like isoform X2 [Pieris brassicae]